MCYPEISVTNLVLSSYINIKATDNSEKYEMGLTRKHWGLHIKADITQTKFSDRLSLFQQTHLTFSELIQVMVLHRTGESHYRYQQVQFIDALHQN